MGRPVVFVFCGRGGGLFVEQSFFLLPGGGGTVIGGFNGQSKGKRLRHFGGALHKTHREGH